MIEIVALLLTAAVILAASSPFLHYVRDLKGFRKYPTQNWMSGISYLGYCWEIAQKHKRFHSLRLHDAHKKHPVMRVGPNWLFFGRAQAAKDIYGYTSGCSKAAIYDSLSGSGRHLVNISDKNKHSARRRMVAAAYAPRNSEKWELSIIEGMNQLLTQMDRRCTSPLKPGQQVAPDNLSFGAMHWSNLFTYEIIIKIGMSKNMRWLEAGNDFLDMTNANGITEKVSAVQCLHAGSRAAAVLVWDTERYSMYQKIAKQLWKNYAKNLEQSALWKQTVQDIYQGRMERSQNGEFLDDLFQPMVAGRKGEGSDITEQDRIAEVDQMINGGGDGPAISLCTTLYYLVKNPRAFGKLREEVDKALSPSDRIAPWPKVRNLEYLKACIDESMRLSPPVATDLLRKTPPEGLKVDTEMVPGDTTVSISAYSAHRDPTVFEDPDSFRPERWLIRGEDKVKNMRAVLNPFSLSTRACIGRNITMVEQTVFLATLVARYDFALPSLDWELEFEE